MTPPWLERAVKLGREAFGIQEDSHPDDLQAAEDTVRDVLELALPALLDGLCPEEPSEEEMWEAWRTFYPDEPPRWMNPSGVSKVWTPEYHEMYETIRAVNRARRARIEKEMGG